MKQKEVTVNLIPGEEVQENVRLNNVDITVSYKNATGKMCYTLKNDYLFRATLQKSKKALKGLICAILGMKPEKIISVEIMNPIELGKSIAAKDFLLDVRVLLNNNMSINMEMQVMNLGNWPERSLAYMCRSFDQLNNGEDYKEVMPVIQVCFLDYTLFKDAPEFFSTYMFINIKSHFVYSDKMKLFVVDLTKIHMATEEDKSRKIDYWARLFKATTWEEVKMLTKNNSYLEEAAETAYQLTTEEKIRLQCEARENYYRQQSYIKQQVAKSEADRDAAFAKLDEAIAERDVAVAERDVAVVKNETLLAQIEKVIAERDAAIAERDAVSAKVGEVLVRLEEMEAQYAKLLEKDLSLDNRG